MWSQPKIMNLGVVLKLFIADVEGCNNSLKHHKMYNDFYLSWYCLFVLMLVCDSMAVMVNKRPADLIRQSLATNISLVGVFAKDIIKSDSIVGEAKTVDSPAPSKYPNTVSQLENMAPQIA
ncbi:hypothetical protein RF11_10911 [Thelohanellus kitauei]|uniref:Uncharacterized protein n=1 Tax=Thelohanellus kitauei TaxID=669202 RepID=A0A0C2JXD1_THEKT|nr:hypothetical protein RF11_10911 [Thelohanellus kitauei]